MTKEIAIIIPAFNEEDNIANAIDSVIAGISDIVDDYEILVFNDGSQDATGKAAEARAQDHPHIRVIHNPQNRGYGYCYRKGVSLATKEYVSNFPGDNDLDKESLRRVVENLGQADVITSFKNVEDRTFLRKTLSRCFVFLINMISGLHLRYYTGCFLAKTSRLRALNLETDGLAIGAECLVKLLRSGCSYKEVELKHVGRKSGASTALGWKSFSSVAKTLMVVWKSRREVSQRSEPLARKDGK